MRRFTVAAAAYVVCLAVCPLLIASPVRAKDTANASLPNGEECRETALAFEAYIQNEQAARATQLIDWGGIVDAALGGFAPSPQMKLARNGFEEGFLKKMRESGGLTSQIVAALNDGGEYRLLRMHEVDGEPRALFRFLLPDGGGVNYHDMTFHHARNGRVRIRDLHIALSGELFSQSLRRAFLPLAAEIVDGEDLDEGDREYIDHLNDLIAMTTAVEDRDFAEALRVYAELPQSVQRDKNVLLIRLQASQSADDDAYADAIADFSRYHPDDPCIDLLSIDGYLLRGKRDESLAAIDRLEERLGGDPFLHVLRAGILFDAGSLEEAEQAARRAIDEEPTLEDAYWQVATVSLELRDFRTTAEMLTLIEDRLGIELADLTEVPEYAEFVKSPEYRDWIRERR